MKQLLKILIGAAWIDGIIQPEERKYLRRLVTEFNLADDPELQPLLSELKRVPTAECYQWVEQYLGANPTEADYQELLEKISGLIYSDGDVDVREVRLIEKVQSLDPTQQPAKTIVKNLLQQIQKLYREAVKEQM
ncbi:MAG TPA: TerB family tellurite resistance protein [Xenococcaceae cyanobacterium]